MSIHASSSQGPLIRGLSHTIASAQTALARSRTALSALQDRLASLYLPEDTNHNCLHTEDFSKNPRPPSLSPGPELVPYFQSDIVDSCSHNTAQQGSIRFPRPVSSRHVPENHINFGFSKDTNVCNISGELTNLLRAQQKLLCQIEKLKCEIGEKSGSIDICLKENQFFNCKFKEIESQINIVKKDVDKIKKDLVMTVSKDRCFSPYSPESFDHLALLAPTPVMRKSNYKQSSQERHFGYQDVCTPDTSVGMTHAPHRQPGNISMNFKDVNCQSTTFEDLIRKSKLDIDCNINNCRNNQNTSSLSHTNSQNHVLMDFVSLNNQIKNLRKMAEGIFKNNCNVSIRKGPRRNSEIRNYSKNNDLLDDQSKSSKTKPVVETTLSLTSQPPQTEEKIIAKEESSSAKSSATDSDTSCCFCTEDQLPTNSPIRCVYNGSSKLKKTLSPEYGHNKRFTCTSKCDTSRCNQKKCLHRNKERNGCNAMRNNCSTSKCAPNHHYHLRQTRKLCPECKK